MILTEQAITNLEKQEVHENTAKFDIFMTVDLKSAVF
jgi:hypothetical protein